MNRDWYALSNSDGHIYNLGPCKDFDEAEDKTRDCCWIANPENADQWRGALGVDSWVTDIATACMESNNPQITGFHRLAGSAAETAACPDLDKRSREVYAQVEAENLLKAVFVHDPSLNAAGLLKVAAQIAERADAAR